MSLLSIIAIAVFFIVFGLISFELIDKTTAALTGAVIFILLRAIDQEKAFANIDWNVIFLLIGMMIIVIITKNTGVFQFLALRCAKIAKGSPVRIIVYLSLITAIISAFLDNVTTIMILTPITILIAVELELSPTPFIIAEAVASNIGGTATLIGDPPNIMIGSAENFTFLDFIINVTPIIVIILFVYLILIYLFFRKRLIVSNERKARIMEFDESKTITDKRLLVKSLIVLTLVILGFIFHGFLNIHAATVALTGAMLLLLISDSHKIEKYLTEIDWQTLLFFCGLFIMVNGLVELGIINKIANKLLEFTKGNIKNTATCILWGSGILSAVIDNIPYVATMIPLLQKMQQTIGVETLKPVWWALSLGACLGGNGTLIGASANVISAGIAAKNGYKISFWEFTKFGAIITIITLILCNFWILLIYF